MFWAFRQKRLVMLNRTLPIKVDVMLEPKKEGHDSLWKYSVHSTVKLIQKALLSQLQDLFQLPIGY